MDLTLTPEQELIRRSAREFVDGEIAPHVRDWDRDETMDQGIVAKLAEVGFLAGWELDTVSYSLVMEELGRVDSSVRGIVSVNVGLVGKTILKWGTEAQKAEWIPRLGSGRSARLLRPDRAGSGVRSRRAHDDGGARRRLVVDHRLEGLHHVGHLGWAGARLRAHRREDHVLPRPHRCARLLGEADQGQARAAGAGHRRADAGRRAGSRRERARRRGSRDEGGSLGAGQRPDLPRGRLRGHRPGLSRGLSRLHGRSATSSGVRSRRSSSCRSCSRRSRSRRRLLAC